MKQNSFHIFYLRLASHRWIWVTALGSGPSLQMISQLLTQPSLFLGALWSACWMVSPRNFPLECTPSPFLPVPVEVPPTKHRYIVGDREAGFKEDTRIPPGSPEALLLWTPVSTRRYLVLSRCGLAVRSSSVLLLLTRKCAEHPSSIPFVLSFSNIHTPSPTPPWESLLYTCFSPLNPGPNPSFHG